MSRLGDRPSYVLPSQSICLHVLGRRKVNRFSIKSSLLVLATLAVVPLAFGQGWPLPAKTPNTPVACVAASSPACEGKDGKLTAPYSDPIKTFVGRYLDSQLTGSHQAPFRTGRAFHGQVTPNGRLYMMVGSAMFAYDLTRFVSRLNAGEAMVPCTIYGCYGRGSTPETFLLPDAEFNAEQESTWSIDRVDGDQRLFGFDWDDRGYVYVAYTVYGWGILKDQGAGFQAVWQQLGGVGSPSKVLSVKTSTGGYYVIASPGSGSSNVYYVGDANSLAHDSRGTINNVITSFAKASNGRTATVETDAKVHVYTNDGIITGSEITSFAARAGGYSAIDTDGTNFFATSSGGGQNAKLTILTYNGSGYDRNDIDLGHPYGDAPQVRWGAGGYLTIFGTEGYAPGSDSSFERDVRLYKLAGNTVTAIPMLVGAAQPV